MLASPVYTKSTSSLPSSRAAAGTVAVLRSHPYPSRARKRPSSRSGGGFPASPPSASSTHTPSSGSSSTPCFAPSATIQIMAFHRLSPCSILYTSPASLSNEIPIRPSRDVFSRSENLEGGWRAGGMLALKSMKTASWPLERRAGRALEEWETKKTEKTGFLWGKRDKKKRGDWWI